jgi:hypothetical protein
MGGVVPSLPVAPIGPILQLTGSILEFVSSQVKDTEILTVSTATHGAMVDGDVLTLSCKNSAGDELVKGIFKIHALGTQANPVAPKGAYAISIANMAMNIDGNALIKAYELRSNPLASKSNNNVVVETTTSVQKGLLDKLAVFNFEAKSSSLSSLVSSHLARNGSDLTAPSLAIGTKELFDVTLPDGIVPLSLSFSLNTLDLDFSGVASIFQKAAAVEKAAGGPAVPDAISKALPSAVGTLSELKHDELAVINWNGTIVLLDNAAPAGLPDSI